MPPRRGWKSRAGRGVVGLFVVLVVLTPAAAIALDFSSLDVFGWFGSKEKPPEPSKSALPYEVTFAVSDQALAKTLVPSLQDASGLYKLRQDAPPDGDTLTRRAGADLSPLIDALWASGYFNAEVTVSVAGIPLQPGSEESPAAIRAAERLRGQTVVPVTVDVKPGPLFTLRNVSITEGRRYESGGLLLDPQKTAGLELGTPATSVVLRSAQAKLVDDLRAKSRPLAKVTEIRPVVDHAAGIMDVGIVVDPGPLAGFGEVTVSGTQDVDPAVIRSFIYLEPGEPYSPKALADTRKSVATITALGSVRIREGKALDANGNLPLFVEVTERPKHLVGFSARYSTVDGPALKTYWEHRNLFGGAEKLRLEGDLFYTPRIDGTKIQRLSDFKRSDIGGRLAFHFEKPALAGSRNDLLVDGLVTRERVGDSKYGGYVARYGNLDAAVRHRFSDTFSIQAGVEYERGRTSDVLGNVDYSLLGVPVALKYDSTDNLLDPTRGYRVTAGVTPYMGFGDSSGFVQSKLAASTYYSLDEASRYVLAARVGFGSLLGANLADIPSNHRFYAGGSGSVRGYTYRSLSPLSPTNQLIGGRSLIDGALEARIKITDTIGIVPFIDGGGAFENGYPDFNQKLRFAAGLGLRYYTAIGPIRVDVATPLNPRRGDKPVVLYISIGQAF